MPHVSQHGQKTQKPSVTAHLFHNEVPNRRDPALPPFQASSLFTPRSTLLQQHKTGAGFPTPQTAASLECCVAPRVGLLTFTNY